MYVQKISLRRKVYKCRGFSYQYNLKVNIQLLKFPFKGNTRHIQLHFQKADTS